MSGEDARVEIVTAGERECLWNVVFVNGVELPHRQRAATMPEATSLQNDLKRIVSDAYRLGHQNGFAECRKAVREAIGAIGETR